MAENTQQSLGATLEGFGGWGDDDGPKRAKGPGRPSAARGREMGAGASEASGAPQGSISCDDGPVSALDVLGFPAGLLSKVPAPWALHCATDGGGAFVITNSRACYADARESGVPVLLGGEWYALAHAAQNDRAWARELRRWIERKRAAAEWRLTHERAFAGMPIGHATDLAWTVGEVLDRVDATLTRVEVRA